MQLEGSEQRVDDLELRTHDSSARQSFWRRANCPWKLNVLVEGNEQCDEILEGQIAQRAWDNHEQGVGDELDESCHRQPW